MNARGVHRVETQRQSPNRRKNGLLPIVVDKATHTKVLDPPGMDVTIWLAKQTLSLSDGTSVRFDI